jgi:serine/threonine-protein phosphatase 2A regulatory subunit B
VTAVEFDPTGDYLAVGDKAGRICIFESRLKSAKGARSRNAMGSTVGLPGTAAASASSSSSSSASSSSAGGSSAASAAAAGALPSAMKKSFLEYRFYTEFQSHEAEFDCLKSLDIDEKINSVKWLPRSANGLFVLATNDKTIKLWKVHEKKSWTPPAQRASISRPNVQELKLPTASMAQYETVTTASKKRVYANAHQYHINSISPNSDGETFISADDLRVNMWSLTGTADCFNIVDLKPPNLEELTEVITSAAFHPSHCSLFLYSSSRGSVRMVDMRDSALCDHHSRQFELEEDPSTKSFFSEITSSVSDAKFIGNGRYILARDYLTLKVWDVNMENKPVAVIPVHDHLRPHLCDLYENDCIFDKFQCGASPDGQRLITGSYGNMVTVYDAANKDTLVIESGKDSPKRVGPGGAVPPAAAAAAAKAAKKAKAGKPTTPTAASGGAGAAPQLPPPTAADYARKALYTCWHPEQNVVAVAGVNKLYIYQAVSAANPA